MNYKLPSFYGFDWLVPMLYAGTSYFYLLTKVYNEEPARPRAASARRRAFLF